MYNAKNTHIYIRKSEKRFQHTLRLMLRNTSPEGLKEPAASVLTFRDY
jgi:hypothetical protein